MTFGSLFAGIGGIDLGLERAGMRCVWQVEKDEFCRRVLAKHWPGVRRHDDVCTFPAGDGTDWRCDLVAGGFPCQDVSRAGPRAGIDGPRSSLWGEYARVVRVLRPRFVLVENVSALLGRGFGRVLTDLAACGYDAEWGCVPAALLGAAHLRDRLFVLADAHGVGVATAPPLGIGLPEMAGIQPGEGFWRGSERRRTHCPYGDRVRLLPVAGVRGVAHGLPDRLDRTRALGNAVVPQIAEWIGRRILDAERGLT